jgi:hypothetical protein
MDNDALARLAALETKVSVLEVENSALLLTVMTLIASHPEQRKLHLKLAVMLEKALAIPSQSPLRNLSPEQLENVRTVVETFGGLHQEPR